MKKSKNLESIYKHLEEKALDYDENYEISRIFIKYRDECQYVDEIEKIKWEIDSLNIVVKDGEIKSKQAYPDETGNIIGYPSFEDINEGIYDYIEERHNLTNNPLLRAQYACILWNSPKKHSKYAKVAIESYIELAEICEKKDEKYPEKHYGLKVIRMIKNAFYLAYNVKHDVETIKKKIKKMIESYNADSSSLFVLRKNFIELMLKEKKVFRNDDLKKYVKLLWTYSEELKKKHRYHNAISLLELGETLSNRVNNEQYNWIKKIAETYEQLMINAEKNNNPTAVIFCQSALEKYQIINEEKKTEELYKKYEELKNAMPLFEVRTDIDLTEDIKKFKKAAKDFVKNKPEEMIKILMIDDNLLPKYDDMKKKAEDDAKRFISQTFFNTEILDQYGHSAQHFSNEYEKEYFNILRNYSMDLQLTYNYLIFFFLYESIKEDKFNYDILMNFLLENTWYGKTLEKNLPKGKKIEYNWINLLAPALYDYFEKMKIFIANKTYYPNLVLCIDSLVFKIEGLLRDMFRYGGGVTFYRTEDKEGRSLIREKDINALLYDDTIKNLFNKNDLLLFRFLLIEKAGYNLRNKVAHSLMTFKDYNIEYMNLLILVILKIGKYDFETRL